MYITTLVLKQFRNYGTLIFTPSEGINVLLGNNAQGKTNLLEAICYLSTFSSPRTSTDSELVLWGQPSFYIQGTLRKRNFTYNVEVYYSAVGSKKEVRINKDVQNTLSQGVGTINTVLFTPEDLYLVKGFPQVRRNYLDREIFQIDNAYGKQVKNYLKILRHRNRLLRDGKGRISVSSAQLSIWDEQLAESGSLILAKRKEVVKKLSLLARLQHRKLTEGREELSLTYSSSLTPLNDQKFSREMIKTTFLALLQQSHGEERRRGMTLLGPHRDDVDILINGRPAKTYGSQGQQRTAALSLKLAEVEMIKGEKGAFPILLLDDVFSELDTSRQNGLLNIIRGKVQTFITGTNASLLQNVPFKESVYYRVEEGRVIRWKN